jgi:uroporphyrinogen decarboxylase
VSRAARAERFLRACRREPVDATPVWFMRQAGRSLPEYRAVRARATLAEITADPGLCAEVTLQPVERLGVDAAILFADITSPLPGIGVEVELVDGTGPVVARPVRTLSDVERLGTFDGSAVAGLLDALRLLRRDSPVPVIGFAGAPFTIACYLVEGRPSRDFPTLRRLVGSDPVFVDALLGRLTDLAIDYLRAQVAAGAQALQVFDSWVGGLSPRDYRTAIAPHVERLFEALAALGVPTIHFGTGTAGILSDMAAAGGDVVGLDWRIDLDAGWRLVGPDRGVQGNLDPWLLLGPWEAVEAGARDILARAAGRPGHVFNLGHGVLPETDPGVLAALVELVHEHALVAR